jgi:cytochrome P450
MSATSSDPVRSSPPGPTSWVLGLDELPRLRRDLLGRYAELFHQYGDVVRLRFGPYPYYLFFHPDAVREVLVTKAKAFHMNPMTARVLAQWDGNGLVLSEGSYWARQRRLMQPAFSPRRFAGYGEKMVEFTVRQADRWSETIDGEGHCDIEMNDAMTDLTLRIVGRTLFGAEFGDEISEIGRAVAVLSDVAVREMQSPVLLPDWLPLPAVRRKRWAMGYLDQIVREFIRQRRATGEDRGDLLSMLLLAVDDEGDGSGMTDQQARDECMTLFLAGHDTTAAGLVWTCYCLAQNPRIQEQVVAQNQQVLSGRDPTVADLDRLTLCDQFVKESMRIFPPAIGVFNREALEDVEIGGYVVRKGSLVQLLSYITQRDPRWFPDPLRFDPTRFEPANVAARPPFSCFPFGGGPRMCIGHAFASMEMTLVTSVLLSRFRLELAPGQAEPHPDAKMSLRPAGGLKLRLSGRAG